MSSKDPIVRDAVEMRLVFALLLLMAALIIQACTAFDPQGAAIHQAPNYYNGTQYSQLSAEQLLPEYRLLVDWNHIKSVLQIANS